MLPSKRTLLLLLVLHRHRPIFSAFHSLNNLPTKSKPNSLVSIPRSSIIPSTNLKEAIKDLELSNPPVVDVERCIRLLNACISSKSCVDGKKIHQHILRNTTHVNDPTVLEKLAYMYVSGNEMELACDVFDKIPRPSVFIWNAMIRGYAWNGPPDRAIDLYHRMIGFGVVPNKFTFPFILKACSGLQALEEGIEIHMCAKKIGLESDVFVSTALIDMYMKCGRLVDSYEVFDRMPDRDIVAWNAMVAGCSLHGLYDGTVSYVVEMQRMGMTPNRSTVVALLPVVGQVKALRQGKSVHGFVVRRFFDEPDVLVDTALLDMYAKCETLDYACRVFNYMNARNEVTWSAMIGGHVICDRMVEALHVFDQMMLEGSCNVGSSSLACALRASARLADLDRGKRIHCYSIKSGFLSDISIGNSLVSMYAKVGSIDCAVNYFDEMEPKDAVSYSAIISGCVQNGNAEKAFEVFKRMQFSDAEPDVATMVAVIPACSHLAALEHGKCSHSSVIVRGLASDISIGNALVDMYAKCGRIDLARSVFNSMSQQDIVSWNTMIASYGIHGLGSKAIALFATMQMKCLPPDDITFLCLIYACSHSGLVNEGKRWFHDMTESFKIMPRMEHYICMVDLLGRGGLLNEARDFIQRMPFEPDVRVWGALLGACRVHENIKLGEEVSRIIQKIGPEGTGNFVLLSNIYSSAGRFDEAARVRIMQKEKGYMKSPGCSWVEISGTVHAFIGGDRSHPRDTDICQKLEDLFVKIKALGYRPDTSFVLHDMEEEEKEHALIYHSEKLAIAFALLCLNDEKSIFITKNLRICGDCHSAIKYITLATHRAITVRDANRFHHFNGGLCNCGDFW